MSNECCHRGCKNAAMETFTVCFEHATKDAMALRIMLLLEELRLREEGDARGTEDVEDGQPEMTGGSVRSVRPATSVVPGM